MAEFVVHRFESVEINEDDGATQPIMLGIDGSIDELDGRRAIEALRELVDRRFDLELLMEHGAIGDVTDTSHGTTDNSSAVCERAES
jgi:hypothetical protein